MSRIRIREFGPIKSGFQGNDGWMNINKVTVFIGNQGSGKSTAAKVISSFLWMEKVLVRGDYNQKWFERKNRLKNQLLTYHRLENYINGKTNTIIEYEGDAFNITYQEGYLRFKKNDSSNYSLPQIVYIPSERNFISYVKTPMELRLSSQALSEFLTEFNKARESLKTALHLPFNIDLEYDRLNDILNLKGKDYRIKLTEASSGFQSVVPLYLVCDHLSASVKSQEEKAHTMSAAEMERFKKGIAEIWSNNSLTEEQRKAALSILTARFSKTAFISIIEEPEQNLYPTSQQSLIYSLLEFTNRSQANKMIITTHSPYIIDFLTLAIKGAQILQVNDNQKIREQINRLVPLNSLIHSKDVSIYEFDETKGNIRALETFNGIPSDDNTLNLQLDSSNRIFSELLEIESTL